MSHKVLWKCDACGQEFTKGQRLFLQPIYPPYTYSGSPWVYSGYQYSEASARAEVCQSCIDNGLTFTASGSIVWATVPRR